MKRHYLLTLILGISAFGSSASVDQAHAGQGITLNEASVTKALAPVGKSDSETTVYTDTMGLYPKPVFKKIQDNPNFILSEQELPKPQSAPMRSVEPPETKPPVSKAREKFTFFDRNENGLLDEDEFFLFELSPNAQQIFERIDENTDKAISFREFEPYYKSKKG